MTGRDSARPDSRSGNVSGRNKEVISVFCHEAMIKGNVIFGKGCIVHPGANINAEEGDIIFGDYNIVEEYARIVNKPVEHVKGGGLVKKTMRIGNYNTFEVGSYVESSDIGDYNDFGVKSSILKGCTVQNSCQFNPLVQVPARTKVESYSVYIEAGNVGRDEQPREETKRNQVTEISQVLAQTMPQHLKTQEKDAKGNWIPIEPKGKAKGTTRTAHKPSGSTAE